MMANIIDGKKIAEQVHVETAREVASLARNHNLQPGLAVVLVGDDPASSVYVNMKAKKSLELGIYSEKRVLDKNATQEQVLAVVNELNNNPKIHGILVQSPPPPQIDEGAIVMAIKPEKDVDCFHPINVGKMLNGDTDGFYPCTPHGIMVLLEKSGIDPVGKHAVIIGRSNIVGKPMMALLMQKAKGANATVTVCHSRTANIADYTRQGDILIAAIGKAEFVTADMVKKGAVVIDVGINRVEDKTAPKGHKLVGDVKFAEVAEKASWITPVPGGVGPMTIAMLMHNAVKACKMQNGI
ncbi:MAG TPA: bifunctional methylenetetrahydrofolate dehydrogenase/methenyltetrahydrofolate cyclohydrolase FolD [Lentisphaeria bacterium]|nr:MAG: bifunctional 5,10-methylene-tetrahydrofolate dehydrogenase/5,10-methylene-tetrahydrofolate cyclohydrolase [Lentisphaerae bacterium GWF2_49_21]HBC86093.1 bifunctional methylenetetrahydrofolate dehydrogenase/methenyltetrahydrofolate cyclohydrolase FolD [Lentisphaeria bacterium]